MQEEHSRRPQNCTHKKKNLCLWTYVRATVIIRAMAGGIFFYPFPGSQITIPVITATVKPGQGGYSGKYLLIKGHLCRQFRVPWQSLGSRAVTISTLFWLSPKYPKEGRQVGVSLLSPLPGNAEIHVSARLQCGMPQENTRMKIKPLKQTVNFKAPNCDKRFSKICLQ